MSHGMLSFEDALSQLLAAATRVRDTEIVASNDALGRVLACDVVSNIDVPPLDNSAMDGYAVRAADIATKVTDTAKRQAHDGAYTDALNSLALAKRYQFDTTASAALATEIRARQVAAQAASQAAATAATKDKLVALIGDAQQLGPVTK